MSALACLVVSAFLAYLIAQFGKRRAASKSTTAWREASELVFDRNLRFQIKQEYEMVWNPVMLMAMPHPETPSLAIWLPIC